MARPIPFHPGTFPSNPGPLARYLPPLDEGVATAWLKERLSPGAWVLDPFGAAPQLALEAARAGFRVIVAANNPVSRMLLEMGARSAGLEQYQAALADLASSYKGQERIEPHIRSLYTTECANCSQPVTAEYFLWERSGAYPYARFYTCLRCGDSGERPTSQKDKDRASTFAKGGLNRTRALERVVPTNDPNRVHAEEALSVYLPRALYALFTMINKMDTLETSPTRRNLLSALLLSACDQANALWAHPTSRERPRQLSIPSHFRENNVWLAMEQAAQVWVVGQPALPLAQWPKIGSEPSSITLFVGRLKDLASELSHIKIEAVLAALPRPNQAFWTLSALWAAWLWGREAVGPFKSVLSRRRYDWGWHTAALSSALSSLGPLLEEGTPVLGLIGEAEPGFTSAALLAADSSGFTLEGVALRAESGQAQIHWQSAVSRTSPAYPKSGLIQIAREAATSALQERGQPAGYLSIHTAALLALADQKALPRKQAGKVPEESAADLYSRLQNGLKETFTFRQGFLRFDGSENALDVGSWWTLDEENAALPLSDRIEVATWQVLQESDRLSLAELDEYLCELFPGLLTPNLDLILHCLHSYGEQEKAKGGKWRLRPQDSTDQRRNEVHNNQEMLFHLADRLGFSAMQVEGAGKHNLAPGFERVLFWHDPGGALRYLFHITATAAIGGIIFQRWIQSSEQAKDFKQIIVLPGSRANLVSYKLKSDVRLEKEVGQSWTFLKYRHLRRLVENPILNRQNLSEQLEMDPLAYTATQIRLL
jgi:DNA-directed RNA polymerase subunit M/transcription elongation factor TFIIS